jgi:hypothetical protein
VSSDHQAADGWAALEQNACIKQQQHVCLGGCCHS